MVDAACSAQVAGQAGDAVWNEPSDGANGVDADHHAPRPSREQPSGSHEERVVVDESPGRLGNRAGTGAVSPRNVRPVLAINSPVVT
jgi:hypothetical protein